jgi:hypothetical protein
MRYPSEEEIQNLREHYPAGARVELLEMRDEQAPPIGTMGTVRYVDDIGDIGVVWDNGSSLSVAYGADRCRPLVPEFTQTVRDQILKVWDSGESNMLLVPAVQRIAFDLGYYELVTFIEEHRDAYVNFILTGHV